MTANMPLEFQAIILGSSAAYQNCDGAVNGLGRITERSKHLSLSLNLSRSPPLIHSLTHMHSHTHSHIWVAQWYSLWSYCALLPNP